MKDKLNREIMVGDTLAYTSFDYARTTPFPELKLAKIIAAAPFAVQVRDITTGDGDPKEFVISDASQYVICDWAKGSDIV